MIYFRQEKYEQAEYNFRRAIAINGYSSVLYCYLGMVRLHVKAWWLNTFQVLHSNKKSTEGLSMLDKAIQLDPKNSLAIFKRATVLASLDQHEVYTSGLPNHLQF
jgi:anaphase-promoting complex subunit 3